MTPEEIEGLRPRDIIMGKAGIERTVLITTGWTPNCNVENKHKYVHYAYCRKLKGKGFTSINYWVLLHDYKLCKGRVPVDNTWHSTLDDLRIEFDGKYIGRISNVIERVIDDTGYKCTDCGVDTRNIHEYYMVREHVWAKAIWPNQAIPIAIEFYGYSNKCMIESSDCTRVHDMFCISCLEKRLGHKLKPIHFKKCKLNEIGLGHKSKRLKNRLGYDADNIPIASNPFNNSGCVTHTHTPIIAPGSTCNCK